MIVVQVVQNVVMIAVTLAVLVVRNAVGTVAIRFKIALKLHFHSALFFLFLLHFSRFAFYLSHSLILMLLVISQLMFI